MDFSNLFQNMGDGTIRLNLSQLGNQLTSENARTLLEAFTNFANDHLRSVQTRSAELQAQADHQRNLTDQGFQRLEDIHRRLDAKEARISELEAERDNAFAQLQILQQENAQIQAQVQHLSTTSVTADFDKSLVKILEGNLIKFNGKRDAALVKDFLQKLTDFTKYKRLDDERALILAGNLMLPGTALNWWNQHVDEFETFEHFKTALQWFSPSNAVDTARKKLQEINQKPSESVQAYHDRFTAILLQIPVITDDEKRINFLRGLKNHTRQTIEVNAAVNNVTLTYQSAVDAATRVGDRDHASSHNPPPAPPVSGGPEPMDVNATKAFQKLTDGQRAYLRANDGCFYCRKPHAGHISTECPERRRRRYQDQAQQNMRTNATDAAPGNGNEGNGNGR